MSAYMCSERELTVLAAYAVRHCLEAIPHTLWSRHIDRDGFERERGGYDRAVGRVFAELVHENLASLEHRYPTDGQGNVPELYKPVAAARKEQLPWLHIIKLCHHYAYQACEHPGWEGSAARKFIDALESHAVVHLPGYNDAPWGI